MGIRLLQRPVTAVGMPPHRVHATVGIRPLAKQGATPMGIFNCR